MSIFEKYLDLGKKYFPTKASWEITSRCNAKCGYCYVRNTPDNAEDLSTEVMLRIIDKLHECGVLFVILTGGEPFLRKDILSLVEYMIRKNFFSIAIFTNGTLIDETHIRFLIDNKSVVRNIQFSVFSHIPEINDAYLGVPGALENTLAIGKRLIAAGMPVVLALNLFSFNVRQWKEARESFIAMGFQVRMSFIKLLLDGRHEQTMKQEISKDFYSAVLDNLDPMQVKKMQDLVFGNKGITSKDDFFCAGLLTNIAIDHRGNILPCIAFRNLPLGSVLEERGIHDILNSSPHLHYIRSLRRNDIPECAQCRFFGACRFCLAMMHTRHNDLTTSLSHYCTYFETLETYSCKDTSREE